MSKEITLELIVSRNCFYQEGSKVQDLLNNLTHIRLDREELVSIAGLYLITPKVTHLYLQHNFIEDIKPLITNNICNLKFVTLANNNISIVPPLVSLKSLLFLDLSANKIADLEGLLPKSLCFLKITNNPINLNQEKIRNLKSELTNVIQLNGEDVDDENESEENCEVEINEDWMAVRKKVDEMADRSMGRCKGAKKRHQDKMDLMNSYELAGNGSKLKNNE